MNDIKIKVGELTFIHGDLPDILRITDSVIKTNSKKFILYLNHHIYNLCGKNKEVKDAVSNSSLTHFDGIGIWLALRFLGYRGISRFNWTDNAEEYLKFCAANNHTIFFFGGDASVLKMAKDNLGITVPGLKILGMIDGFTPMNDGEIIRVINEASPNILWVGLGSPKQELWIYRNIDQLTVNIIQSTGDIISELGGIKKRGPRFIQIAGFEWLIRLINKPGKYWQRYLIGIPHFVIAVIELKLKQFFKG